MFTRGYARRSNARAARPSVTNRYREIYLAANKPAFIYRTRRYATCPRRCRLSRRYGRDRARQSRLRFPILARRVASRRQPRTFARCLASVGVFLLLIQRERHLVTVEVTTITDNAPSNVRITNFVDDRRYDDTEYSSRTAIGNSHSFSRLCSQEMRLLHFA